jgi:hypothetical protein
MDVAALVQRSREAQGLPPTIGDPGTLARIAELIALRSVGKDTRTTAVHLVTEEPATRQTRTREGAEDGITGGVNRMGLRRGNDGCLGTASSQKGRTGTRLSSVVVSGADDPGCLGAGSTTPMLADC